MPSILPSRCEKLRRFSGFTRQVFSSLPVRVVTARRHCHWGCFDTGNLGAGWHRAIHVRDRIARVSL